ncbi:MAG: hypothetical protein NTV07_01730 [Candidatus Omnitrophica bacterium]|nr:hypothetical protein [Candidatus Omnitrophota bacterium]
MKKKFIVYSLGLRVLVSLFLFFTLSSQLSALSCFAATDPGASLNDLPPLPKETELFASEKLFGYRGKIGGFVMSPSRVGVYYDQKTFCPSDEQTNRQAMKVMYKQADKKSFCGAYVILMADLSQYKTVTFMIKGRDGKETFEIGLNDVISNKREDAVFIGAINRYLPGGITKDWKEVKIPLSDFYGPDISKAYSLIFGFNQIGQGVFWVDEIKFFKEDFVAKARADDIKKKGYLLLDDFDYSDLNLLGRKTNAYKKLPSVCLYERVPEEHYGPEGRSLKMDFKKDTTGWCGYYTMLNQIDGEYYDLSPYRSVSFMVKGKSGGEKFEIGMADKNWVIIGDSLKAGGVDKYLAGGVTTQWKEVVIPLEDFGLLDFTQMGSLVMNFSEKGEGTVYIDDIKFYLKESLVP